MLLTATNFKSGFLVDDESIGGVTELDATEGQAVFAAYVSHYVTGETLAYREFDTLEPALAYLHGIPRAWKYEAVGCKATVKSCGGGCSCS
jgi:hypothetical protein